MNNLKKSIKFLAVHYILEELWIIIGSWNWYILPIFLCIHRSTIYMACVYPLKYNIISKPKNLKMLYFITGKKLLQNEKYF